jgi:hypothetical protein
MRKFSCIAFSLFTALAISSCNKSFLNRPPEDVPSLDNFYTSDATVNFSTRILYNSPWFDYNDKARWGINDVSSGNLTTFDNAVVNFKSFNVGSTNEEIGNTWRSLYNVVSQSNSVIKNLPSKSTAAVSKAVIDRNVAEAKLMRAVAYFELVRLFGAVPIIDDNDKYIKDPLLPRHRAEDIYKFIVRDLEQAELVLPVRSQYSTQDKGRAAKGTAQGLLAKVALYQRDFAKAKSWAEKVIQSGEYGLMGLDFDIAPDGYENLFKSKNNNSQESMLALQWFVDKAKWGVQNTNQAYFAAFGEGLTGTADGWGSAIPSADLLDAFTASGLGDKRRKATCMLAGDSYSYLKSTVGGYTYTASVANGSITKSHIKKYVVGSPADNNGIGDFMRTFINTYLLRYADVLLIYAEATIGNSASTTDATALAAFNKVRTRAGLDPKINITKDDVLKERRLELAIEGDYWFDLGRLDGVPGIVTSHPKAIAIISNQNRGEVGNPTKFTPLDKDFYMPIPSSDVTKNPKLKEVPVPFNF